MSAGFTIPGYLAEALTISPQVTQGPYYPLAKNIPLDDDNDLVQLLPRAWREHRHALTPSDPSNFSIP